MNATTRLALPAVLTVALGLGCTREGADPQADGTWVGTITTEGNVTTVINESGSVWGGTATLVEEATIGVESGADEYMLGSVGGVFVDDTYIYVVDRQLPKIRVYDLEGTHVRDLGREGQGPGEYTSPSLITGDGQGRVFVLDSRAQRFNVFSADGEDLGTWPAQNAMCCAYPMVPAGNGNLWARRRVRGDPEERPSYYALQQFGPDGETGEIRWPVEPQFEPVEIMVDTRFAGRRPISVPFGPAAMWITGIAGTIITGASDRYRFEIQNADGSVQVVERFWTPVPIASDEAEWHRRFYITIATLETANEGWSWDGAEMPATKPAFEGFIATRSGEIWVRRAGPGERASDCVDNPIQAGYEVAVQAPCWRNSLIVDAFDAEGRYLGEVGPPAGLRLFPSSLNIDGDRVVGVVESEAGTIMVKRYRLVLPGDGR